MEFVKWTDVTESREDFFFYSSLLLEYRLENIKAGIRGI